jgi:starch synthase
MASASRVSPRTLAHAPRRPAAAAPGWTFDRADAELLRSQIHNALKTYREHRDDFVALQRRAMEQDLSWDHAATIYEEVLVGAKYQW